MTVLLMTLVLGSLPGLAETVTSDFAEPSGPVSVLLLMDASGSMAESDPNGLRWEAARYFVDFLSADSVASGQSHEAGIMTFESSPTLWLEPKRVIQSEDLIKLKIDAAQAQAPVGGWTDFAAAVDLAVQTIRENDRLSPGQRYAIVLFTDGVAEPGVARRNMTASQVAAHYARMSEALSRLSSDLDQPAEGYVVTMGVGYGDAGFWRGVLGEAAGDQRVFRVDTNADYFQAFGGIGASLLGMTRCDPTVASDQIVVPNYLEGLVFTLFKPQGATVDPVPPQPDGSPGVEPFDPGSGDYLTSTDTYQIVSVAKPAAGPWAFTVSGARASDVFVWWDWLPARLILSEPKTLTSCLRPLELKVDLLYPRSLEPVPMAGDTSLSLRATVTGLGDKTSRIVDASGSTASFEQTLISAPVPKGLWTVEVAPVNTATAQVVRAFSKSVYVDDLPVVGSVSLQPLLLTRGVLVHVRATVEGSRSLLFEPSVAYELRDAQHRLLAKASLTEERDVEDAPTGDYIGVVQLPATVSPRKDDSHRASDGWFRDLLSAVSPDQGRVTLTVTLAGYCRPAGATGMLRYEDLATLSSSLGLPVPWMALGLVVLLVLQTVCLWPGAPRVGEITYTDAQGFAQVRASARRINLGGGTVIKAVPWMLTRFNWSGVTIRVRVLSEAEVLRDLAFGETLVGVPFGDGAVCTIENTSLEGEGRVPLGRVGHVLSVILLLAIAALIVAVVLPGLVRLPGPWAKVLMLGYGLSLLGPPLIVWCGYRRQILER